MNPAGITQKLWNYCNVLRDDGLWDIEAHLLDTKTDSISYPSFGVAKPAGHPVHEMKIRVTVDSEMLIHDAEAVTIHAPFEACVIPATIFPELKGLSFNKVIIR